MPGNRPGDVDYFAPKRDEIARALEAAGRDPADFTFAAQLLVRRDGGLAPRGAGHGAGVRRRRRQPRHPGRAGDDGARRPRGGRRRGRRAARRAVDRRTRSGRDPAGRGSDGSEVRRLDDGDAAGRRALVEITNAVTPEWPTSLEELRLGRRHLSRRRPVPGPPRRRGPWPPPRSAGSTCTSPAFERYWFGIHVLPEARRRGLGTALWAACSAVARQDGKTGPPDATSRSASPDGLAFLEHRGFEAIERMKMVQLDLRGLEPPADRAARRDRPHDAGRAAGPRARRPRGRGRGVPRHPERRRARGRRPVRRVPRPRRPPRQHPARRLHDRARRRTPARWPAGRR